MLAQTMESMTRTMRTWRLDLADNSLDLREVPEPEPRDGAVVVRVEATALLSYLREYAAGRLESYNPPPGSFTPGTNAIGVIEEIGRDVYGLHRGQRVFVSCHYRVAENIAEPAEALLGLTADPRFTGVLRTWPDGTLAERVVTPAATVTPVPPSLDEIPSERLAALSRCLVPYGGFLRGRLAPGETVVVNGATGGYGGAGVHVALAMGAARVVAAGRNTEVLSRLAALDRVRTVRLTGDSGTDAEALRDAAGGPADCALDMVGGASAPDATLATLAALGRGGRLVLMGSMLVPLPLDSMRLMLAGQEVIGNFMYPADAPRRLLRLIASGRLDLERIPLVGRPLADLHRAMDEAAAPGAPLVVVRP